MELPPSPRWSRRTFLASTVAAALVACSNDDDDASSTTGTEPDATDPSTTTSAPTTDPTTTVAETTTTAPATTTTAAPAIVTSDPFTLGVASGDPLDTSVILWTRLLPADGPLPDDDVDVTWEVARDPDLADVVASGVAPALAALGHSVHVDASGLEPDTVYHYRFTVGEFESPVARTRTFAAAGTTPTSFRFAFSSCQNWEQGEYAAYRHLVETTPDLDAFVFLGDYIYEYATGGYADDRSRSTGQDFECETLDQYRARYALYKSDPHLQAAHALAPWIITWDDHEVDNDYAGAVSEGDDAVEAFLARRAAGYQAWYEHMPVRVDPPEGPDLRIYRSTAHGDLLRFHVLDTRQYRADQQRGDPFVPQLGEAVQVRDPELAASLDQTILGADQREWLLDSAEQSAAIWDVLAQQVFMFGGNALPGAQDPVIVVDTWDGYAADRAAVLGGLSERVDNLVVLTGDFHSAAVADLRVDPFDDSLPVVGSEFMATSISSSFFDDDAAVEALVSAALSANPHLKWFDAQRGYTLCEVTPERWTATFQVVADQFDAASAVDTATVWEVTAGTPGPVQLT